MGVAVDHLGPEGHQLSPRPLHVGPPKTQIGTHGPVPQSRARNDADLMPPLNEGPLHARHKCGDPAHDGGRVWSEDGDPGHPAASRKTRSIRGPIALQSYSLLTFRRTRTRFARCPLSSGAYWMMRRAIRSGSGGHTAPVAGSVKTSDTSPTSVENTGVPHARLSSMTVGNCSMSDVRRRPSAAEYNDGRAERGTSPRRRIRVGPSSSAAFSRIALSDPVPATRRTASGIDRNTPRYTDTARSGFFSGASRPTNRSANSPESPH